MTGVTVYDVLVVLQVRRVYEDWSMEMPRVYGDKVLVVCQMILILVISDFRYRLVY